MKAANGYAWWSEAFTVSGSERTNERKKEKKRGRRRERKRERETEKFPLRSERRLSGPLKLQSPI